MSTVVRRKDPTRFARRLGSGAFYRLIFQDALGQLNIWLQFDVFHALLEHHRAHLRSKHRSGLGRGSGGAALLPNAGELSLIPAVCPQKLAAAYLRGLTFERLGHLPLLWVLPGWLGAAPNQRHR
jgi:hypothetical protein